MASLRLATSAAVALGGLVLGGCGGDPRLAVPVALSINEVVADNEGAWLDELGEADDYVELYNAGPGIADLSRYRLIESAGAHRLPRRLLRAGELVLFWADDAPEQGELHLPFQISSSGEFLALELDDGELVDSVRVPPLEEHHAYLRLPDGAGEFEDCSWATPARANGAVCGPPERAEPPGSVSFADFVWPEPWPEPASPLALTELALRPAEFVEIRNGSAEPVETSGYELRLAPFLAGDLLPGPDAGVVLPLPEAALEAGERMVVPVDVDATAELEADPAFDGVATLWRRDDGQAVDRLQFRAWPEGAALARVPDPGGALRFCEATTPGAPNEPCQELASREVGDRVHSLSTPGDFEALAGDQLTLGTRSVGFMVDMTAGNVVTMLNTRSWDLHYTFHREVVEGLPHLDRCDPTQRETFNQGWYAFSETNYFVVDGRRYLLGTLVKHAGTGHQTVEFSPGDVISAEQMKHAFFTVMRAVPDPQNWLVRPQAPDQLQRIRDDDGELPILDQDAPFRGVTFQPLAPGLAYGTLRFVPADELAGTPLGPRDIVVTDQVPNNIPLIGGLITETFQTPLAHVNILSRGRGTPNMALRAAREDGRVADLLGQLVRLEVTGSAFDLAPAAAEEALAFWESQKPDGPPLEPRLDLEVRGLVPVANASLADVPSIGGKAAQLGELTRVAGCAAYPVSIPRLAFAVPLVHSLEHFEASGAAALFQELRADPEFLADPLTRAAGLERVRRAVQEHPVAPELQGEIRAAVAERFPGVALRFRSSSNTEDLAGFSGAGLYESEGIDADAVPDGIEDAVRQVWASLWSLRAYDEREFYNVNQDAVAMAVLVHQAFRSERVNGVAVSRDVLEPNRGDRYYINAQVGEALVTNPAPGVASDVLVYGLYTRQITYHERSSFSPTVPVASQAEVDGLACNLYQIHQYFRPLIDPAAENTWFAVDIEWKLMGPERGLVIKQARPYSFGSEPPLGTCEF